MLAKARQLVDTGAHEEVLALAREAIEGYRNRPGFRREEAEVQAFVQRVESYLEAGRRP